MQSRAKIEQKLVSLKPILASKYFVDKIGYFGSFADKQQTAQSDLDILVEFSKPVGWEFFSLEMYLEQHLGIKVDLVTRNALKDGLREGILDQVRYV